LVGVDDLAVEDSAFDHQDGELLRRVVQCLGGLHRVALDESDGRGAGQHLGEFLEADFPYGYAGQRVLQDLVFRSRLAKGIPDLGDLGDGQASVLGQERGGRFIEASRYLLDLLSFLRSDHVCSLLLA
jgi:hypothetical protein